MEKQAFVLCKTFYDAYQFRIVSETLERSGIIWKASNAAPTHNYHVPVSAYTEIELYVLEKDLFRVMKLLENLS